MLSSRVAQASLRASAQQFSRRSVVNGARTYAAAAQDPKPPVALFGVDGTYANALTGSLEQTSKALNALAEVFKKDAKLGPILHTPTLTAQDKSQIVQELQKLTGKNELLGNFFSTLAENNRLGVLQGVCEKFETLMGAYRGEIELNITSAQKLDQKTIQRLETAIAKSEYSQGKKLKVVTKVDPEIVGGLIVEFDGRTIDLSVSSKLTKLNKALTDAL
ncbi:ATP synthase oligomycin sensitivity conferral protein [Trichophyton tonsurans CBS 112818]|uniref:ATP synthase subunit 5, mitochondrial n=1 Tax=Trichophyton tonsurans (strain CBS 112818) TaxID=647933 RepID=F2RQM8_TRIT1|nr:ATP synthase oligomycin sensitivity conferral protein [Trichophyton tonsurans CBS 112818]KMQ49167.1 F1F0 ATP synthase OSCP/delta subunit, N-terminal domain [Trichophyton rubrum]